jgi:hypothetical protein
VYLYVTMNYSAQPFQYIWTSSVLAPFFHEVNGWSHKSAGFENTVADAERAARRFEVTLITTDDGKPRLSEKPILEG